MEIDPLSPVPLHEQVAAAIRRAIAQGEAKSGQRLPPGQCGDDAEVPAAAASPVVIARGQGELF